MATVVFSVTTQGGCTTAFKNAARLEVTYTAGGGSISITALRGCRTDSTTSNITKTVSANTSYNSTAKSATVTALNFYKSSNWKDLGYSGTSCSGLSGNTTVSITLNMESISQGKPTFSGTIDAGTAKDPAPYNVSINPVATSTTAINLNRTWAQATYCQYNIQNWGWINEGTSYSNGVHCSGNDVTGLSPNTTYSCQVRFGNGNSDLTYSNTANCTTLADPPTNLQITNLKSYYKNKTSDICISGNVSATSGTAITNYTLYYKRSIDSTYTSKNLGTGTTFELTNLQNNTVYNIYFTASNSSATATSTGYNQTTLQMYCVKISQNGTAFVTKRMYYSLSGGAWMGIPKDKLKIR